MRLIARMPDRRRVGSLIDSLRNDGFDRKDMIVTDLVDEEEQRKINPEEVADEIAFIKTEQDELWESDAFADDIKGFNPEDKYGIIVAVKTPKHKADRVRAIMEQSGAVEIIQD